MVPNNDINASQATSSLAPLFKSFVPPSFPKSDASSAQEVDNIGLLAVREKLASQDLSSAAIDIISLTLL